MNHVNRDANEFCLVEVQLIIALWILISFASICKFILTFLIAYICVFSKFSFELGGNILLLAS